jgi:hypothetical protein
VQATGNIRRGSLEPVSIGKWLLIAVLLAATAHQLWKVHERSVVARTPNTRANHYSVSITSREQMPLLQQTSMVLGGEIPVVIVNGMAKANPTAAELASEYRRGN